ncbi:hypothetical protein BH09GEM1_BH09GEM1_22860 [soil metagenome]
MRQAKGRTAAPRRLCVELSADGLRGASVDMHVRAGPAQPALR